MIIEIWYVILFFVQWIRFGSTMLNLDQSRSIDKRIREHEREKNGEGEEEHEKKKKNKKKKKRKWWRKRKKKKMKMRDRAIKYDVHERRDNKRKLVC